jgi:hypothetical protein
MRRNPHLLLCSVLFAIVVSACGGGSAADAGTDPRDSFVGVFSLSRTKPVTVDGQTDMQNGQLKLSIAKATAMTKISLSSSDSADCVVTATVTSTTSFTVDPVTCPAVMLTGDNQGCTEVDQYLGGTASSTGTTFNFNANGNASLTCDGQAYQGTFTLTASGTKV